MLLCHFLASECHDKATKIPPKRKYIHNSNNIRILHKLKNQLQNKSETNKHNIRNEREQWERTRRERVCVCVVAPHRMESMYSTRAKHLSIARVHRLHGPIFDTHRSIMVPLTVLLPFAILLLLLTSSV